MTRNAKRGTSLIEILVYSVLLMLLLGGVYTAFYISKLYYDSAQATSEAQQEALKAMNAFSRILSMGHKNSVLINSSPPGVMLLTAETNSGWFQHDSSSGDVMWQRWVLIYRDPTTNEIVRKDSILGTATSVPPTSPPVAPPTLMADNSAPRTVLARDINNLVITQPVPNSVAFNVTTQTTSPRFGVHRVQLQSQVTLKQ